MQIDTEWLIRLATRLASPSQIMGASCCMFVLLIAAAVEAFLADAELKHIYSYACVAAFCVGLIGVANPMLRLSYWR